MRTVWNGFAVLGIATAVSTAVLILWAVRNWRRQTFDQLHWGEDAEVAELQFIPDGARPRKIR